jgi:MFS family permease
MNSDLDTTLGRLVADGTLTSEQALAVTRELTGQTAHLAPASAAGSATLLQPDPGTRALDRPSWTSLLAEVGGYVGGAFVLAAAVVLTGPSWGHFGTAQRLAILGVPAAVLLVAAAAVLLTTPGGPPLHHRRGTGPRRRLASALTLVAAVLAGGVADVAVDNDTHWEGVGFTLAALVVAVAGYLACRTAPLHVGAAALATALAGFVVSSAVDDWERQQVWIGVSFLAVASGWLALTLAGAFDEAALGLTAAGVIAFVGGEVLATQDQFTWLGYLTLALVAAAGLAGYVRSRHVAVLAVGVVALGTVVPQAVIDYTDGAFGAAGALLLTGLSILGASVLGLRLRGGTRPRPPAPPVARAA